MSDLPDPHKASKINLYDKLDNAKNIKLSVSNNIFETDSGELSQKIKCSRLEIVNNDGKSIANVVQDLYDLKAEDVSLNEKITTEQNTRLAEDASLDAKITTEKNTRLAEDASLDAKISTEKTERLAEDASLDTKITAEKNTRIAEDASLDAKITDERKSRIAEDDSLDAKIKTEKNERLAENVSFNNSLIVERQRIDTMLAGSSIDLNILKELVDNYNQLDSNQATQINILISQINILQSRIDNLIPAE